VTWGRQAHNASAFVVFCIIATIIFTGQVMLRQVHQILPTLAYGDAIGNQVLELRRLLREWGYASEIFAEHWHPRFASECRPYEEYRRFSHLDNLLILHYSIGGAVNRFVLGIADRRVIYYHNITPAHFFYRVNGEMARWLEEARRDLALFAGKIPALAASPYNQQELGALGFKVIGVAPYILTSEQLESGAASAGAAKIRQRFDKSETIDWLFVGRLVPNKCIHDIIKTFYYYHAWMAPNSRLFLVGSGEGTESYLADLYHLVTRLGLDGAVIFAGHYAAADGLAAFYQMADVYLSMSEHEGFCIPLVEAMRFDIPVLAYASTGVPYTMGNAGVLFQRKEYPLIAEMVYEIIGDTSLRERLVTTQRARLDAFAPEKAREQFRACLTQLI
jgi:glycosyltransferase involved in cell wall biosynthesis